MENNIHCKPIDEDGYPRKRFETCLECKKRFCLTFAFSIQNYARKNFWDYWTQKESDVGNYICDSCLRLLYTEQRQKFLTVVENPKRRNIMRSYISDGLI
jgi:hypothetical protein